MQRESRGDEIQPLSSLMGIFNADLDRRHESQTLQQGEALLKSLSRCLVDKLDHRILHKRDPTQVRKYLRNISREGDRQGDDKSSFPRLCSGMSKHFILIKRSEPMNLSVCYWGQKENNIRVEQITVCRQN